MASSSKSHFSIFLVFFFLHECLLPIMCCQSNLWHEDHDHVGLFIFGDSFYDAGNNIYLKNTVVRANYWPYGSTFFKYPTGRVTDGRIIPDFIAEHLNLHFISPYLEPGNDHFTDGANFASAGAGALVETHQGLVIDLPTQLSYFKKVVEKLRQKIGDAEIRKLLSRAIYLINIGSNDYMVYTINSTVHHSYSAEQYIQTVIGNLTTLIKEIYKSGGRKFGFQNLMPLGCLPLLRALNQDKEGSCITFEASDLANLHNQVLSEVLKDLREQLSGFKYSSFDIYSSLSFSEEKMACCGSGPYKGLIRCGFNGLIKEGEMCENVSEYLFFDSAHPTEKAYNQFADLMWSGSSHVTTPYNLKTLVEEKGNFDYNDEL